ncbi:MAG: 7-carboxy-7-deazaguanine synthase QueE [Candidatus Omnitrophica bacterium]|nr:7-carboxy-7-deazaguanine synthase QueE [Candidatus Omnitrophota bacterium]
MKAKISEIFRSVQGEGKYLGVDQIFVRFSGCNLSCDWCDTPSAQDPTAYAEMSSEEILSILVQMGAGNCHSISLTGGEPLLQSDFLLELLPELKKKHYKIYLETNGVLVDALKKNIRSIDIISMDFKLPSSCHCKDHWEEHLQFLKTAKRKKVFVKAVISKNTVIEDVSRARDLIYSVASDILLVLQPNAIELDAELWEKCCGFQQHCAEKLRDVRVIPQVHRLLGIR